MIELRGRNKLGHVYIVFSKKKKKKKKPIRATVRFSIEATCFLQEK
jgi:hypothetical protein